MAYIIYNNERGLSHDDGSSHNNLKETWCHYRINEPVKITNHVIDDSPELPNFSKEANGFVYNIICNGQQHDIIIEKFNLSITRLDLNTLVGSNWLNDNVINFYMGLLTERSRICNCYGCPKIYAMNTFFMTRLLDSGYEGVRRWTRNVDLFSYEIVPVPVLVGQAHWTMAIIDFREKSIKYYDSLGLSDMGVLLKLLKYLILESIDKRKSLRMDEWKTEYVTNIPLQWNESDCGVFSCMFAEYITMNKPITFTQNHMAYFRKKMILEIAKGELFA